MIKLLKPITHFLFEKRVKLLFFFPVLFFTSLLFSQNNNDLNYKLPSVLYVGNSLNLNAKSKLALENAAALIKNNPSSKVKVIGYCGFSKITQQRSWRRVNEVIKYLVEKQGISEERIIFLYGETGGNCNVVDLIPVSSQESGPKTQPAPFPHLNNSLG